MKQMTIYDPAMCCPTGICGPGVDPNLMRVATIIVRLKHKGFEVKRHNLTSDPGAYVENKTINKLLMDKGIDVLPVTVVDGEVVKTGQYPTDLEFIQLLDVPEADANAIIKNKNAETNTDVSASAK